MVNSTLFEKFMTIMAAVYMIIVPRKLIFRPYLSERRGIKVAENVHPKKKLIPMNAIVDLLEPTYTINNRLWITS
jgi:hypothetical protein